jgi:hypothetical protein
MEKITSLTVAPPTLSTRSSVGAEGTAAGVAHRQAQVQLIQGAEISGQRFLFFEFAGGCAAASLVVAKSWRVAGMSIES